MKKSIFLIVASFILAVSMAGCSMSKQASNSDDTSNTANSPEATQDVNNIAADADKKIDMDKVEGTDAQTVDDSSASGKVGDTEVEISDAKVIKYNDYDVLVVSYQFKNKTGEETTFTSVESTTASQAGQPLGIATVVGVEGVECDTLAQPVKNGEKITVQKAFRLDNLTDDVTIEVDNPNSITETAPVSKTFKIAQ